MPTTVTEILTQFGVFVATVGILWGIDTLRRRRNVSSHWLVLAFLLLLWVGLFLAIAQPVKSMTTPLSQIAGGMLVATAVIILSAVLRVGGDSRDSELARLFGNETAKRLAENGFEVPGNSKLNARALVRFARILRAFGYTETVKVTQKVMITACKKGFFLYDLDMTIVYKTSEGVARKLKTVELELEVKPYPAYRTSPGRRTWGVPLDYDRPKDKWPGVVYVPLIDNGDVNQWNVNVATWSSLVCDIKASSGAVTDRDTNEREPLHFGEPLIEDVEIKEPQIKAKRVVYVPHKAIKLPGKGEIEITYKLKNIPHPVDHSWMAWTAADVITSEWSFEVSSKFPVIRDVLCLTTFQDMRVYMEDLGSTRFRITLEPRNDPEAKMTSVVMPYDCILISLDPAAFPAQDQESSNLPQSFAHTTD